MEGRFGTFRSAFDTIIVSHKIDEKKLFFHRFHFTSSDSPLTSKQPTQLYWYSIPIRVVPILDGLTGEIVSYYRYHFTCSLACSEK
jgi:hypothetical protein